MYRFPKLSDRLWDLPGLPLDAYRGFYPGMERPERGEFNHSPPGTTQFKNEWIYTADFFTCLHGFDRDDFTVLSFTHNEMKCTKLQQNFR
jgi:hypothetical protein